MLAAPRVSKTQEMSESRVTGTVSPVVVDAVKAAMFCPESIRRYAPGAQFGMTSRAGEGGLVMRSSTK